MRYIICYKLHRKNGTRKEFSRFDCENDMEAISYFQDVMFAILGELRDKDFELLTGDWKHVAYYTIDGLDRKDVVRITLKPIDEVVKESKKDEIYTLYKGMTKTMQKAVKDIMLVANGKEIEE